MRIYILGCRVLTRELSALIARSRNQVDVAWVPQGLHDTPAVLQKTLKEQLETLYRQIEKKMHKRVPDYIVLGYGMCSKAVIGLEAKKIPLVVPRAEDCIALFLGSQKRYLEYFAKYKGTFWLNSRWIEDCPDLDSDYEEKLRAEYMEQYEDEDTVDFLLEMHRDNLKNYTHVGYISSPSYPDENEKQQAARYAADHHLQFMEVQGTDQFFRKMVDGDFDDESFLVVQPGYQIVYDSETNGIKAVPAG